MFRCDRRTVRMWCSRPLDGGSTPPTPPAPSPEKLAAIAARREHVARELAADADVSPPDVARTLFEEGVADVSVDTVRRDFTALGYRFAPVKRAPNLTRVKRAARVSTCRLWRRPSLRDHVVVVWSDEKMMRAGSLRGGAWQKEGDERRTVRHETWTPQLHMWGCIAPGGRRGRAHRLLVRLPKVGAGKRGGVGGTDYLALLKTHLVPFLKRVRADHPTKRVVFIAKLAG